tara:strand:+ start:895 stop:1098 length:204 start_codon:yes stop_codon:yes gene_type:complete
MGAKEFGEWVKAPATLMFFEKYFFAFGNMQPEEHKAIRIMVVPSTSLTLRFFLNIIFMEPFQPDQVN